MHESLINVNFYLQLPIHIFVPPPSFLSLRAQFAEEGAAINMLHGSDSEETAQKEIEYFFPMEQTLAAIKPDAFGTKGIAV